MKVCLICEGSYPYIPGGVSTWVQMLLREFPDIDFTIWAVAASREEMPAPVCPIPHNVKEIRTVYLGDAVFQKNGRNKSRRIRLSKKEKTAVQTLINSGRLSSELPILAKKYKGRIQDLLTSGSFFDACADEYRDAGYGMPFLKFLWNARGMCFPLLYILSQDMPEADIYHAVSAGYAGVLGAYASQLTSAPLLLSEHGIYTREREEDIIRSSCVDKEFKSMWTSFFKKLSALAYEQASVVTTLFEANRRLQIELGCPAGKIETVPNGIQARDYPPHNNKPRGTINIGTVSRVVPIKDIKTLLLAFDIVKKEEPSATLSIMANCEENPEYYNECVELLGELGTKGVTFMGHVDIRPILPEMDVLVLCSISEGQPISILEGFSVGIPFVATDVGDCRDMLYGSRPEDKFGQAGLIVPVMDCQALADAILSLIRNPDMARRMGEAGRQRVAAYYKWEDTVAAFRRIYNKLGKKV